MNEPPEDPEEFVEIGSFAAFEATKVTDLLEYLEIEYEVEFDDSEIRNLTPAQSALGGTYGLGARVHVYVEPAKVDHARVVVEELFPV